MSRNIGLFILISACLSIIFIGTGQTVRAKERKAPPQRLLHMPSGFFIASAQFADSPNPDPEGQAQPSYLQLPPDFVPPAQAQAQPEQAAAPVVPTPIQPAEQPAAPSPAVKLTSAKLFPVATAPLSLAVPLDYQLLSNFWQSNPGPIYDSTPMSKETTEMLLLLAVGLFLTGIYLISSGQKRVIGVEAMDPAGLMQPVPIDKFKINFD